MDERAEAMPVPVALYIAAEVAKGLFYVSRWGLVNLGHIEGF